MYNIGVDLRVLSFLYIGKAMMTAVPGVNPEKASAKLLSSCLYLGMQGDPETHVGYPDSRNCCSLLDPPTGVMLSHQERYCLTSSFQGCEVYLHSGELPWPAEIFETGSDGKRSIPWPMLALAWSRRKVKSDAAVEPALENVINQGLEPYLEPDIEAETPEAAMPYDINRRRLKAWLFIAISLSLLIILAAAWGADRGLKSSRIDSERMAENAFLGNLATAVQGIGVVARDWGTAIEQMGSPTWTPMTDLISSTGSSLLKSPVTIAAASPSPIMATPTPIGTAPIYQDVASIYFQIISGPYLDPEAGGKSRVSKVPAVARAIWGVKNTGSRSWFEIYLSSILTNEVIYPVITRGGQVLDLNNLQGNPIAAPGEEIALTLEFQVNKEKSNFSVNDEWYLVVDGITLTEQPRFIINADKWITIVKSQPVTKSTVQPKVGGQPRTKATSIPPPTPPPPSRPMPIP